MSISQDARVRTISPARKAFFSRRVAPTPAESSVDKDGWRVGQLFPICLLLICPPTLLGQKGLRQALHIVARVRFLRGEPFSLRAGFWDSPFRPHLDRVPEMLPDRIGTGGAGGGGKRRQKLESRNWKIEIGREKRNQDAGLPDTNRRDPHKAGESPALHGQKQMRISLRRRSA